MSASSKSGKQPIIRRSPIDNLFTSLEEEGVRPYRQVKSIALSRIDPNPLQPRRRQDEAAVAELTESIRAHDLQNPINVCQVGDRYVIVSGHLRYEACRRLGRTEIPALVRVIADQADGLVKALIENVQRTDLDPLDEARSYRELMALRGWSLREVARQVGKSPAHVQGRVSLLNDDAIIAAVERGLAARTAAEIARIADPELRHEVLQRTETEKLDINDVVREIRAAREPASPAEALGAAADEATSRPLIADPPGQPAGNELNDPAAGSVLVPGELVADGAVTDSQSEDRPARAVEPDGRPSQTGHLSGAQFRWLGRLETLQRSAAALQQELPPDLPSPERLSAATKVRAAVDSLQKLLADLERPAGPAAVH